MTKLVFVPSLVNMQQPSMVIGSAIDHERLIPMVFYGCAFAEEEILSDEVILVIGLEINSI